MGKYFYKFNEKDMEGTSLFMSNNSTSIIEDEFMDNIGKAEAMVNKQMEDWKARWEEREKKYKIASLKDERLFGFLLTPFLFILSIYSYTLSVDAFNAYDANYPDQVNGFIIISGIFFGLLAGSNAGYAGSRLFNAIKAHKELKKLM